MGDIRTSRREDCARAVYSHLHMDELKRQAASFFLTFTLNYNYRLMGGCLHTKGPCGLRSAPALVASHEAAMWSQSQNVGTRASRSPCLAHGLCGRGSLLSHPRPGFSSPPPLWGCRLSRHHQGPPCATPARCTRPSILRGPWQLLICSSSL